MLFIPHAGILLRCDCNIRGVLSSVTLMASPNDINQPKKKTSREEREARKRNIWKPIQRTKAHVFPGGPRSKEGNERPKKKTHERIGVLSRCWVERLEGWGGAIVALWLNEETPSVGSIHFQSLLLPSSLYQVVLWIIEMVGWGHCVKGCSCSLDADAQVICLVCTEAGLRNRA